MAKCLIYNAILINIIRINNFNELICGDKKCFSSNKKGDTHLYRLNILCKNQLKGGIFRYFKAVSNHSNPFGMS